MSTSISLHLHFPSLEATLNLCETALHYLILFRHGTYVHEIDMLCPAIWTATPKERTGRWHLACLGHGISDTVVDAVNKFWDTKCSLRMGISGQDPLRWLETEWKDRGRMWAVLCTAKGELGVLILELRGST